MKYIIFSDVDGTLYDREKTVSPQVVAAVKKAQARNVEFVLATGNGPFSNMQDVAALLGARYLISSNGALILDLKTHKALFKAEISKELAQRLVDIGLKHNVAAAWWDMDEIYVSNHDEVLGGIAVHFMHSKGKINYTNKVKSAALKLQFVGEPANIKKVYEEIKPLAAQLQIAYMNERDIELTHIGVSKGEAIRHFVELFQASLGNCMGIGDSNNDRTMLELLEHSYAMGNGNDEIKRVARRVTKHVAEHGVAHAIEDFLTQHRIN